MTVLYNITTDGTIQGLFTFVANNTPLGAVLLVVIFAVSFFNLKRYDNLSALVPTVFITFLAALLLFLMQMVADYYVYGLGVLLGISVIALRTRK